MSIVNVYIYINEFDKYNKYIVNNYIVIVN
ncbi:MAG: hypothetical protein PWP67_384 [Clostridium butyricum]|jgi:hypothetical protein|nr:MAG: hypothetical protein Q607_CBUC00039G0049 [Clostridium butyricum DORA_1]MDK2827594.1 hypothetical protein [Clostridium butyricum]